MKLSKLERADSGVWFSLAILGLLGLQVAGQQAQTQNQNQNQRQQTQVLHQLIRPSHELVKSSSETQRSQQQRQALYAGHRREDASKLARRQGPGNSHGLPAELLVDDEQSDPYLSEEAQTFESSGASSGTGSSVETAEAPASSTFTSDYEPDVSDVVDVGGQAQSLRPLSPHLHLRPQRQLQQNAQLRPPANAGPQPPVAGPARPQGQHRAVAHMGSRTMGAPMAGSGAGTSLSPMLSHGQLQQSSPVTTPRLMGPLSGAGNSATTPISTFTLGADRMLIKQQQQQQQLEPQHQATQFQSLGGSPGRPSGALEHQELATESIQHELLSRANGLPLSTGQLQQQFQLMYAGSQQEPGLLRAAEGARAEQVSQIGSGAICYTPLAFMTVVLATMLLTVLLCFAGHYLMRHLSRHQFDLIANSKQFESKHGSSLAYLAERRHFLAGSSRGSSGLALESGEQQRLAAASMLNLLLQEPQSAEVKSLQRLKDEHGCAFDNPYFRDEPAANLARRSAGPSTPSQEPTIEPEERQAKLDSTRAASPRADQLNTFIEHHISKLHNRQVTSSVKELSVLGSPAPTKTGTEEQPIEEKLAGKMPSEPNENELVAVDLTGHDIIGLGFDVQGNASEGIFVRSVLARGPARESGSIEPGDRIRCVSISFDQITLQDASDILNCGAPYRLRLLLEKRAQQPRMAGERARQPAPILLRRNQRLGAGVHQLQQRHQRLLDAGYQRPNPLAASIKACLRRLSQWLSPGGSHSAQAGYSLDYRHQFGVRKAGAVEPLETGFAQLFLGSAAARRHLLQSRGSTLPVMTMTSAGQHLTAAYSADDSVNRADQLADQQGLFGGLLASGRHRLSLGSLGALARLHGSNLSVDSLHRLNSSRLDLEPPDSSLDYQQRNANHRLHGPPVGPLGHDTYASRPLGLAPDQLLPVANNRTASKTRRQSVATPSSAAQPRHQHFRDQMHLEQSQSQPEMAIHPANESARQQRAISEQESADTGKLKVSTNPQNPSQTQLLAGSISTPAVNLLVQAGSAKQ